MIMAPPTTSHPAGRHRLVPDRSPSSRGGQKACRQSHQITCTSLAAAVGPAALSVEGVQWLEMARAHLVARLGMHLHAPMLPSVVQSPRLAARPQPAITWPTWGRWPLPATSCAATTAPTGTITTQRAAPAAMPTRTAAPAAPVSASQQTTVATTTHSAAASVSDAAADVAAQAAQQGPAVADQGASGGSGSGGGQPAAAAAWQQRTVLLIGEEGAARLAQARVLVVGLGGVGSYAAEWLARAGVGSLTCVDADTVDVSNSNRQLHAMHSTVGRSKVDLMAERIRDIAPGIHLTALQEFVLPETVGGLLRAGAPGGPDGCIGPYDWVLDCIDSLEPKKLLIAEADGLRHTGLKVITACGAGGRLDPGRVRVVPLSTTFNDPFAANMRKGLRRRGVALEKVPAVWSDEPVSAATLQLTQFTPFKRSYYGTISYLPATFGLLAAAHVINDIISGPMASTYKHASTRTWLAATKEEAKARRAAKKAATTASQQQGEAGEAGEVDQAGVVPVPGVGAKGGAPGGATVGAEGGGVESAAGGGAGVVAGEVKAGRKKRAASAKPTVSVSERRRQRKAAQQAEQQAEQQAQQVEQAQQAEQQALLGEAQGQEAGSQQGTSAGTVVQEKEDGGNEAPGAPQGRARRRPQREEEEEGAQGVQEKEGRGASPPPRSPQPPVAGPRAGVGARGGRRRAGSLEAALRKADKNKEGVDGWFMGADI